MQMGMRPEMGAANTWILQDPRIARPHHQLRGKPTRKNQNAKPATDVTVSLMTTRLTGILAGGSLGVFLFVPSLLGAGDSPPPRQAAPQPSATEDSAYTSLSVFTRALELIRQDYVDDKKICFHDLTYGAMRGMLAALDPHSQFMDPDDFKGMQDDTKSQFGGLGVVVSIKDGNHHGRLADGRHAGVQGGAAAGRPDFEDQRQSDRENGIERRDCEAARRSRARRSR